MSAPIGGIRNASVGYILLFVARLSFVLATSAFGFVFIIRKPEFQIPTFRYVVFIIGLFALFCYTQELEQPGRAFIARTPAKGRIRLHCEAYRQGDYVSVETQKLIAQLPPLSLP